jgi:hypothetical protein
MEAWEQIKLAEQRMKDCAGEELMSEFSSLARTARLFIGNEREFGKQFETYEDLPARLELWDARNREAFEAFLDEVDRLLHNYLASVTSLRDHTRRLWTKLPPADPAVRSEYQARVDATFTDSPLANFVHGLRNFSMHRQLPVVRGQLTWTPDTGETSAVVVSSSALREWDGWNASARAFLEDADEDVDLQAVVAGYSALVQDFHQWFGVAFVGGHLPAFDEWVELRSEYVRLLRRAGVLRDPRGTG